jgi:Domain of unknown function (DUF4082)
LAERFPVHYLGTPLLLIVLALTSGTSLAQLSVFGTATPGVAASGDTQAVVLGVRVFSDVPGKVLGCSFYKGPANIGVHVVSLWDSTGKLLATQAASNETASGKQLVIFSSPVQIAANQTFTCGYLAPQGHYAFDLNYFLVPKNVPPLHMPVNAGVYVYGTQTDKFPTGVYAAANYWVDVMFAPSTGSSTWISGTKISASDSTALVTWNSAVPSDSQVEYGATTAYGSTTPLAAAQSTAHSVAVGGLSGGTTYHLRVRSRDSDAGLVIGPDSTFATIATVLPVSISALPLNATVSSGQNQQFIATVSNTSNLAVSWRTTAGTINSSGSFTAPTVSSSTSVTVTATSQADTSKSVSATVTVNPAIALLTVTPVSLSFAGQVGAASPTPASVSVTNAGGAALTFIGTSDQPWLMLSAGSGTTPSTLGVTPSIAGLKAGNYTGHIALVGGGATKTVTVAMTITSPPIQHKVALSWKASTNAHVVSYSVYRSSISGSSYALSASAIGGVSFSDQSVQPATTYYYVVTAVDDQGRESAYSPQVSAIIP